MLAAPDHLVPDIAFFQRRPFVGASSLNGVEVAGAAQNQHLFPIRQLGSKKAFLFQGGKLPDEKAVPWICSSKILTQMVFATVPDFLVEARGAVKLRGYRYSF